MPLWNGLGQLATVAQLTGVDAAGLTLMILEAVQTVKRNREECKHLARRAMMIGDLLQKLQGWDMMQDPEIRRPLDGLDDALREAYVLISSCQECSIVYRFLMGWKQAEKFCEVQKKIDSYIDLYPFIIHIDLTRRLDKLYNSSNPSSSQIQVTGEISEPCTGQSNNDAWTVGVQHGMELEHTESRSAQESTNHYVSEVRQLPGYREHYGMRSIRRNMSKWRCRLLQEMTCLPYTHRLTDCQGFLVYRLSVLKAATNNFSSTNLIGCGGFGTVYKGRLYGGGPVVAIKRCSTYGSVSERKHMSLQFEREIRVLAKLQHVNVVRLLGYCFERGERILVYEYLSNGSLDKFIFGTRIPLDWSLRFGIIIGMAQGIVYLHEYSGICILHRDLKPSNILLDNHMKPKITDFGLATMMVGTMNENEIRGTFGYLDPEYLMLGACSRASDVYGFGVILLEIITMKRSFSFLSKDPYAVLDYAWEMWRAGRALELIDPVLQDDPRIAEILRCIQIALLCVEPRRDDRPTMPEVILMLSSHSVPVPPPQRRGFEDAPVGSLPLVRQSRQSGAVDSNVIQ